MARARVRDGSDVAAAVRAKLKDTPEQRDVVGPLVLYLIGQGWSIEQIQFGRREWRVPKNPSQATNRERGRSFEGFPVDVAVFDDPQNYGDYRHLLFIVECKQPNETAGVAQLETYYAAEPHAKLGIWVNDADPSANATFLFRQQDRGLLKRMKVSQIPQPGDEIKPDSKKIHFADLIQPTESTLRRTFSDLLDRVVVGDSNVTRGEDRLDQLCNLILLKLESDKQAKASPGSAVVFRPMESAGRTAEAIRKRYSQFVNVYPGVFTLERDKKLTFSDDTIAHCVESLAQLRLIDLGVATISVAFQVLRAEALKAGEGQYFTPQAVIEAGVQLLEVQWEDIVIDPACGTGGFLVEVMLDMARRNSGMSEVELSRWAQTRVHGIEQDAIGLKLTKAIMQIAGDGSANCVRGDSVRVHKWGSEFPHLNSPSFQNGRFSVVVTNPPFGKNLKVSADDARLAGLDLAKADADEYKELEIGLLFLQRAHQLLKVGGRVGIVLPETYFFSSNYVFLFEWMKKRLKPIVVANIPMEAFQGFCRAKTNFYVFEKIGEGADE